jgi:hypothetical protein
LPGLQEDVLKLVELKNFLSEDFVFVLTTDEKGERMITMGCISSQPIKYQCGMFGLLFSK